MAFYGWRVTNREGEGAVNEAGEPIPPEPMHKLGYWHNAFSLVLWFFLVYYCAHLWTTYVDAWCARVTRKLEEYVFEDGEKSSGPLLS